MIGEASKLLKVKESLVSRRRGPGRPAGKLVLCAVPLFCMSEIEDFRPFVVAIGVPSLLEFCVGAFNGELTEFEKSYIKIRTIVDFHHINHLPLFLPLTGQPILVVEQSLHNPSISLGHCCHPCGHLFGSMHH